MANEFYITAGLIAQDSEGAEGTNAFYITAGLIANDYVPAGGQSVVLFFAGDNLDGSANPMMG